MSDGPEKPAVVPKQEVPPRMAWRDLVSKDRPHVVLFDGEDDGDVLDDDVTTDYGSGVPDLWIKKSFYTSCVKSWQNVVIKQMGSRRPLAGSRFGALGEINAEEFEENQGSQVGKDSRNDIPSVSVEDKGKGVLGPRAEWRTVWKKEKGKESVGPGESAGLEEVVLVEDFQLDDMEIMDEVAKELSGIVGLAAQKDKTDLAYSQQHVVVWAASKLDPLKHSAVHVLDNPIFNNNNCPGLDGFFDDQGVVMMSEGLSPGDPSVTVPVECCYDAA
ncbi:OLC1v1018827C1 [Oldenlandia corymbosa var. corymbosa]|uniref:OLC1v1018827C1 n=1 Tax=Oldenlandia corymbosa var. corymbosa TaxID=529605 RepID=A0AAV1ECN0_OLDCO|nr:OLC1v1018827C1 [Oldenlandia corymbosa var. corymbosa]